MPKSGPNKRKPPATGIAKGAQTTAFYRKYGFEPSPLDERQLMLLMRDLRATLKSIGVE